MCFRRYFLVLLSLLFIATGALRAEDHCQGEATAAGVMSCCEASNQQSHGCCLPGSAGCHPNKACSCDNSSHDALLTASATNYSAEADASPIAIAPLVAWYEWRSEPYHLRYRGPPPVRGPAGKIYLAKRALLI